VFLGYQVNSRYCYLILAVSGDLIPGAASQSASTELINWQLAAIADLATLSLFDRLNLHISTNRLN
jgi:hypothetical protein